MEDEAKLSSKVAVPTAATMIAAGIIALAGLFVDLPEGITADWALELVGAVVAVVTLVGTGIGWRVPEKHPSPSAVSTLEELGWVRDLDAIADDG